MEKHTICHEKAGKKFCELLQIIELLRSPAGCPWDQKQTPQSFKSFFIEETHELTEALNEDDPQQVREELGDLFFQLGFINQLYEEQNLFTISDVLQSIIDKMIRRHPHVFENKSFATDAERSRSWAEIKEKENKSKNKKTYALDVPKTLPALIRAQRVCSRAARTGFEWPDQKKRVTEISKELIDALDSTEKPVENLAEKIGDMMLMLVNFSSKENINSEEILHQSTDKFINRFKRMELLTEHEKTALADSGSKKQKELWAKAKEQPE